MIEVKCPVCGSVELKVIDSRPYRNGVKRRRECQECFTRFSTFESVIFSSLDEYIREKYLKSK